MADQEEDDLQMALRMSLQGSPPEAKRIKPRESVEESPEARNRRVQRELMAAAAEKRLRASADKITIPAKPRADAVSKRVEVAGPSVSRPEGSTAKKAGDVSVSREAIAVEKAVKVERVEKLGKIENERMDLDLELGEELAPEAVDQLFSMVFGSHVSRDILAQWTNQGIRFSSDPETHIGLVQHEGGPCGVLATIQAFVLKNLLFARDDLGSNQLQNLELMRYSQSLYATEDDVASITEDRKTRALVQSMVEILFMCGGRQRAVVATIDVFRHHSEDSSGDRQQITKLLEDLSIVSATDFHRVLRIKTYKSQAAALKRLTSELHVFQSRMGAMLFLISALLSRGLESIQADRDDPSLPLVTAPFGHASQEIVNLLLCGQAVPNVFDGRMDLGGDMFLKGIPTSVDVGFLTLLESLNFCKVGQHLKCPKWPIWVVGSESHYTVLFALDPSVQHENELEERELKIRRAFDAQDQSGGGGFISVEGFHQVIREASINFPPAKLDSLTCTGFIVWSEFWQALLELDKGSGGFKDSSGLDGRKQFHVYHFNGIAKSVLNGNAAAGGEIPLQRPRLCKLSVSVPPKWNQDEYMADAGTTSSSNAQGGEVSQQAEQPSQHAPLVDCIRTRWPRATCNWVGDAPSIV